MLVPTALGTHIKVSDISKSKDFYDSLGLTAVFAMGTDEFRKTLPEGLSSVPEKYNGIIYDVNGATIEIAGGHIGIKNQEVFKLDIHTEKVSAMIHVKSLAPLFDNKLVNLVFPIRKYYWGTIEAAFRDPDGFVIVLIAKATDEEFEAVSELTNIEVIEQEK